MEGWWKAGELKRFQDQSFSTSLSLLKGIALKQVNTICGIFLSQCVCMHTCLTGGTGKKEVNQKVMPCTNVPM